MEVPREGALFEIVDILELPAPEAQGFTLCGELDVASCDDLHRALATSARSVIVDLSELTFCDSSGVAALVTAKRQAEATGRCFSLVKPSPTVRRVFELLGLGEELAP